MNKPSWSFNTDNSLDVLSKDNSWKKPQRQVQGTKVPSHRDTDTV